MLKLVSTLPNLPNICLHISNAAKSYSFTESEKDLLAKIRGDMVGGPSIVFTRKPVVGETFNPDSTNWCTSTVRIDASQLYPFSMSQAMTTDVNTRWDSDTRFGVWRI